LVNESKQMNDNPEDNINNNVQKQTISSNQATFEDLKTAKNTPAMAQYLEIKSEHPQYLLFYRMGDFYELFFEDAITVSGALGLTLTSRSKLGEKEIPMCGVPFHAYEMYLARLIKMNYKVAICEQTESPEEAKKRGYKSVVRREVVRLVTAGTITEESLLEAKKNNYIVSVCVRSSAIGMAWLDISTGAFYMQNISTDKIPGPIALSSALARLNPSELVIEDQLLSKPEYFSLFGEYRDKLAFLAQIRFNYESAIHTLLKAYKIKAIETFGDFSKEEITAGGTLLEYVENTQKGHLPRLEQPKHISAEDIMEIDSATRRSLELINSATPSGMSLLKTIDRTTTPFGGRLLAERLTSPIMNIRQINDRLDAVSFFLDNPSVRHEIRKILHKCLDMERSLQRLSIGHGGPRDLYDLAATLKLIPAVQETIFNFAHYQPDSVYASAPSILLDLINRFFDHSALQYDIETTLLENRDDLPALARNGKFVRQGAYQDLDYLRNIRENSKARCKALADKYIEQTGITGLKIKDNSVIGYFVEVPLKSADKILNNPLFIHRQSVLNAVRFTTLELSEIENEVNNSTEKALEMELEIYQNMVDRILAQGEVIHKAAEIMATLDVDAALAELAAECDYTRPVIDESMDFEIIDGRHPVVEAVMKKEASGNFIGNSCKLSSKDDRIWLLTGPNMAGKSTFLRQNALIAIMAQMGSFVPAKSAKIGVINKIFSRVGASDDLARGRSTFMVEMVETAAILNRADERSFVILDEIGRGTATFDGLSIAWAVVEQLAEVNKCRTLFATHYHELTKLTKSLKALSLHCMKIKEFNGDVVFMHEVIDGAADRSYGIHVAELAGLPRLTIKRAEQVLTLLEEEKQHKILNTIEDELPLFAVLKEDMEKTKKTNPVIEELKVLDIDTLSPREALDKLYELKQKAQKQE